MQSQAHQRVGKVKRVFVCRRLAGSRCLARERSGKIAFDRGEPLKRVLVRCGCVCCYLVAYVRLFRLRRRAKFFEHDERAPSVRSARRRRATKAE